MRVANPKKPSQFIKTYINKQLNQLQVEQQELKQRLEASTNAPVEFVKRKGRGQKAEGKTISGGLDPPLIEDHQIKDLVGAWTREGQD